MGLPLPLTAGRSEREEREQKKKEHRRAGQLVTRDPISVLFWARRFEVSCGASESWPKVGPVLQEAGLTSG